MGSFKFGFINYEPVIFIKTQKIIYLELDLPYTDNIFV